MPDIMEGAPGAAWNELEWNAYAPGGEAGPRPGERKCGCIGGVETWGWKWKPGMEGVIGGSPRAWGENMTPCMAAKVDGGGGRAIVPGWFPDGEVVPEAEDGGSVFMGGVRGGAASFVVSPFATVEPELSEASCFSSGGLGGDTLAPGGAAAAFASGEDAN